MASGMLRADFLLIGEGSIWSLYDPRLLCDLNII